MKSLHRKLFLPFILKLLQIPIPDQSQFHQSLPLKTKIQFYQNFLPAKRSANHSMFFRRLLKANFDISILLFRFFISLAVLTIKPTPEITPRTMGFIVTLQQLPQLQPTGRGAIHEQIHFLESAMRSFQAPESFVIKSEKIFDFFQFFFLNVGVDVIEIKDALFSSSHFVRFQ